MLQHANKNGNHVQPDLWNGGNGRIVKTPDTKDDTAAKVAELEAQLAELKRQITFAKGTEEVAAPKVEVKPEPRPVRQDLSVRIEQTLRARICTTEELARAVGEPLDKVKARMKDVRKYLADVGTAEEARWVWRIGDDTPAKELRDLVARLITDQPMTTAQLAKVTGARMPRVNGVLVDLQRNPDVPIYNVGSDFRARWWIMPKTAKPANLPPKVVKK